jgi:hypothetical protein
LSQPGYLLKRLAYLGPRGALVSFRKRLFTWLPRFAKGRIDQTQLRVGQERIEVAASSYRPRNYEGRVLLLMASVRAPHINFLPGWQTCVPFNLHAQYLEGHHNELTSESNVQSIAAAIASHLTPSTGEVSLFCHTSACASTGSAQAAKPAEMWDSTRDGSTRARAGNSTLSAK